MKIKFKDAAFVRINQLTQGESKKSSVVSERLLLNETLRQLNKLNVILNTDSGLNEFSWNVLNRLFPELLIDGSIISELIDKNKTNNSFFSVFNQGFIHLYIEWELLCEDEKIKNLSDKNPYEYVIRIFERGFPLISVHNFKNSIRIGYEGEAFRVDVTEYTQEIPYIVSTDDAYLDAIDAYYLEYNKLPQWLEDDNKRGYVIA